MLSTTLTKIYSEIWDQLNKKYITKKVGSQQYFIINFMHFKMADNKLVADQIHDYHLLVNNLKSEGIEFSKRFLAGCFIKKLPESQSDYIKTLKHKKKPMSLEDVILHIKNEEKNMLGDMAKNLYFNANIIETNLNMIRDIVIPTRNILTKVEISLLKRQVIAMFVEKLDTMPINIEIKLGKKKTKESS